MRNFQFIYVNVLLSIIMITTACNDSSKPASPAPAASETTPVSIPIIVPEGSPSPSPTATPEPTPIGVPVSTPTPTPIPTATPVPTSTPVPTHHVRLQFPQGYALTPPAGFKLTNNSPPVIEADVLPGTSVSVTASKICKRDIVYTNAAVSANVDQAFPESANRIYGVTFWGVENATSFSIANNTGLACGTYKQVVTRLNALVSELNFTIDGLQGSYSFELINHSFALVPAATPNVKNIGSHEIDYRRFVFSVGNASNSKIQCTRNGGNTYQDCDTGNTFILGVNEINKNILQGIRVIDSNGAVHTRLFYPSQYISPTITFHECTDIVESDIHFAALNAKLLNNKVVCLMPGLTITALVNEPSISTNAANFTLIGGSGRSRITSNSGNVGGIATNSSGMAKLYNLDLSTAGSRTLSISQKADLQNVSANASGISNTVLELKENLSVTIASSSFSTSTIEHAMATEAIKTYSYSSGSVLIDSSTLTSRSAGVVKIDGSVKMVITNSTINGFMNTVMDGAALDCLTNAELSIKSSIVRTNHYAVQLAAATDYEGGDGGCVFTTEKTSYESSGATDSWKAFRIWGAGYAQVNSTLNQNSFCGIGLWTNQGFTGLFDEPYWNSHQGSFNPDAQTNHGVVTQSCPQ